MSSHGVPFPAPHPHQLLHANPSPLDRETTDDDPDADGSDSFSSSASFDRLVVAVVPRMDQIRGPAGRHMPETARPSRDLKLAVYL